MGLENTFHIFSRFWQISTQHSRKEFTAGQVHLQSKVGLVSLIAHLHVPPFGSRQDEPDSLSKTISSRSHERVCQSTKEESQCDMRCAFVASLSPIKNTTEEERGENRRQNKRKKISADSSVKLRGKSACAHK